MTTQRMGSLDTRYDRFVAAAPGRVPPELDGWIRAFGLQALVAENIHAILTWVRNCSPRDASPQSLTLACMDLQTWFILDDHGEDDEHVHLADYAALLDRWSAQQPESRTTVRTGFVSAVECLLTRMAAQGRPLDRLIRGKLDSLRALQQRNEIARGAGSSFAGYLDVRMETINARQWMNLWEVLEGCMLTPEESADVRLREAMRLHCIWQVYLNERCSLERDTATGTPNLVCMLQRELCTSRAEAIDRIRTCERWALRGCTERLADLAHQAHSPRLRRYLEIFDACIQGTIRTYQGLADRYTGT